MRERTLTERVGFALGAARALAGWHEQHGVYGRLGPEAFVTDRPGTIRLALRRSSAPELAYLAPEQTGRLARGIDERTDLYAFGVVLYRLLTDRLPFEAVDALDWVHCHLARRPMPPSRVREMPAQLERIVLRLLAKQPEERYQTARGVVADLEQCQAQLASGDRIAPFALARYDVPDRLVISQRLYGRHRELSALRAAFDRVAAGGGAHMVCLVGEPGIGKSAVMGGLAETVAAVGGRLLGGKADGQLSAPYQTIAEPLAELVGQLLAEPDERLTGWRTRLSTALGSTSAVLVDVVPALVALLGKQPPLPQLSTMEARNRLRAAVSRFVAALGEPGRPLVLALDDLHWADAASIDLLRHVLRRDADVPMLVIGAYRPGEVPAEHHLAEALRDLAGSERYTQIQVGPLDAGALTEVLADTLRTSTESVAALATVVGDKTGGNPLFVGQFLHGLRERGLLRLGDGLGWHWDLPVIAQAHVTDNVVDLVAGRISLLPQHTRRMLTTAALLGDQLDVAVLALATKTPPADVVASLHPAVQERFLLRVDTFGADGTEAGAGRVYRWQHDRIRQAVWSRIPARDMPALRLAVGHALQREMAEHEERLFDVVEHLNAARDLLTDELDQIELARLNLAAAERIRRASGPEHALTHADLGLRLLPKNAWCSGYDLTLRLHFEAARCADAAGDRDRAERLLETAYARARSDIDRVEALRLRMRFAVNHGQLGSNAFELGLRGLAMLGFQLPVDPAERGPAAEIAIAATQSRLESTTVEAILGAPLMTDPGPVAAAGFVGELLPLAHADPQLLALLTTTGVGLALGHGLTNAAAPAFVYHSAIVANRLRDDRVAGDCLRVAAGLLERFPADESESRLDGSACSVASLVLVSWYDGPGPVLASLARGQQRAVEQGDQQLVALLRAFRCGFLLRVGISLAEVTAEVNASWAALAGSQVELGNALTRAVGDVVHALSGVPMPAAPPPTPEELALRDLARRGALGWFSIPLLNHALLCSYFLGDHQTALELAEAAQAVPANDGTIWSVEATFYQALTLTALYREADRARRRAYDAQLDGLLANLERWAAAGPISFAQQALLVTAERTRIAGDTDLAMARYDQAIGVAREHGYTHIEALAGELAAGCARHGGDLAEARNYLRRAAGCYERWGATVKREQLEAGVYRRM